MKKIILAGMLIALSGCAHAYVESWNGDTGEMLICGNGYANYNTLEKTAQKSCMAGYTPIAVGGETRTVGYYTSYNIVAPINRACVNFRCEAQQTPSPRDPASN